MSPHDAYARRTPFELLLPDAEGAAGLVSAIGDEARARGLDPSHRGAFASLTAVGEHVARARAPEAPPEALPDFAALLFHAYHFVRAGCPLYLASVRASRRLAMGAGSLGPIQAPADAGYLQLPRHLFWLESVAGGAAESVDGAFWTTARGGLLHVLLAAGMRPDRPGLAVVEVAEAPLEHAPRWLDAQVRTAGGDFTTALPGADLGELYAFRVAGEVLKLIARFFALLGDERARVTRHGPVVTPDADPIPSGLPYQRVEVDA